MQSLSLVMGDFCIIRSLIWGIIKLYGIYKITIRFNEIIEILRDRISTIQFNCYYSDTSDRTKHPWMLYARC
ncbi:hypothetical protein H1P_2870002 [Hyella patelloides LEGE 07179]|uniref:Uncharacterized protein n=1 Tax=Hyella patelloides LEGE 07179 TaxID=945734 RepID=A0A563VTH4_9CYAN|nr:hypothetical protein H1P_2870002 [Hyella patelloides LEGE 07179]